MLSACGSAADSYPSAQVTGDSGLVKSLHQTCLERHGIQTMTAVSVGGGSWNSTDGMVGVCGDQSWQLLDGAATYKELLPTLSNACKSPTKRGVQAVVAYSDGGGSWNPTDHLAVTCKDQSTLTVAVD